ncbi:DRAP deaminase [Lobosporangium transversale]|uniref:Cytidine deaminase-like protein n=1 Tax=Lobosporangium transversale TaxID=64571 RepID=A0A1Y2GQX8_9FUNG|nr:cytidine deaminase-like protein [Lobosporangium transversale]KAF9915571.1 DRAP deaminase [Lobosporangium transversale]ORZ14868.1 cytidine deaminase-like protein [Lobosporangium transversale]|eukprot:XP_021881000.1 cytidine deaminase-like protein [Lobosporangium transversale]
MATALDMQVLSKDDKDATMHFHFMKLAIEQAKMSIPVQSGFCVGAVLVQETYPDPNSDFPQEDRFRVVATGFSRELEGNTHAEECCLLKLEALEAAEQEKERELESDVGVGASPASSPIPPSGSKFASSSSPPLPSLSPEMDKQYKLRHPHPQLKKEWIMYTTMEPCGARLSGNKPCSERLIEAGIRRVYVGVREPRSFVKDPCGVEKMIENGITVVHIPGLEEHCLAPNRHILTL